MSLLEVTEEIVALSRGLPTRRTKTTKYRYAIGLVQTEEKSLRGAAELCDISRKQLKKQYEHFCDSNIPLDEYKFVSLKKGRKDVLSNSQVSILRVAVHALDGVGHPVSKTTMNHMIMRLNGGQKILSRATLSKYRKRTRIPKKTVRNGPSVRNAKSKAEFILDFHEKLNDVITKYKIRKELM
jgi:hypothetical protein